MAKIIVRYEAESNSLDVWFGEPTNEFVCEEVEDNLILKKDKAGNTIGLERLNCMPAEVLRGGERIEIDTGAPLGEAQGRIREISERYDKEMVYSSAFFITLLNGQLGSVATKYLSDGRRAENMEVDIADILVCSLAYLNWLGKDATEAFLKSLQKHEAKLADLGKSPRTSRPVAKVLIGVEEQASKPGVSSEMIEKAWQKFQQELGVAVRARKGSRT